MVVINSLVELAGSIPSVHKQNAPVMTAHIFVCLSAYTAPFKDFRTRYSSIALVHILGGLFSIGHTYVPLR